MSAVPSSRQPTYAECDELLCRPGSIFEMEEMELLGNKQLVWKNAAPTFRDFLATVFKRWSSRVLVSEPVPLPAEFYERQYITYAQVWVQAVEMAAWLREQGIRAGTRVAIGGLNSSHWIVAFVAAHLLGAVPVLLNSTLQIESQIHCLALAQPAIVLVDAPLAEILAPVDNVLAEKKVGKVYCWTSVAHLSPKTRAHVQDTTNIKPSPRSIAEVEKGVGFDVNPESDGLIMFTSGTTNLPKAVLVTQRGCLTHTISSSIPAARAILRMGGSLEDALAAHNPPEVQGTMLLPVPLFHVTGSMGWMMRAFQMGMKMAFMRRWSVPDGIKLIVDEKIGVIGGVPSIATSVIQSPLLPKDHIIEGVTYGGAPPPKRLADDIAKRWPTAVATHAYGMTETCGLHTGFAGPDYVQNPEAVGPGMPVDQIRIVDADIGKPLAANTFGMVQCRGPNIMKCYVDNPTATAEALSDDGWLTTGDLGIIDEMGFLWIRDRAKDMIIRGGENIASAEVENAITQDDRIAEAAAVPVPDDVLGERVGLGVALAPGATATPQSLMAAVQSKLRHPARPAIIVIFPALPRNANGKIVKNDVKAIVVEEWKKQGGGSAKAKL